MIIKIEVTELHVAIIRN